MTIISDDLGDGGSSNSAIELFSIQPHLSGEVDPSAEDKAGTRNIKQVCELVGINLVDHIIIWHGRYTSFADLHELWGRNALFFLVFL